MLIYDQMNVNKDAVVNQVCLFIINGVSLKNLNPTHTSDWSNLEISGLLLVENHNVDHLEKKTERNGAT